MNIFLTLRPYCSALFATFGLLGFLGGGHSAASAQSNTILVVGDSLSAEYGLQRGTGWVALLQARLTKDLAATGSSSPWKVVNASISGDTTAGGRARLPQLLQTHQPQVVIIELGGNDALRGLAMQETQANVMTMVKASQTAKARVLLLGMQMPPNYGQHYADQFKAVFAQVAKQTGAALVPFFLAKVADIPNAAALFQADRIHPNESAQQQMMSNVWTPLVKLLKSGK